MKRTILLIILCLALSCGKEKSIQLPEIDHSEIIEIHDVSAAYLFYDKTQKDSMELNQKNLISTTNWLVNVDKRLTLKQVIPHIKFLQEKKANSSHKNENAKNYFTCHDLSRNNLGFIEFTDVVYENEMTNYSIDIEKLTTFIRVENLKTIKIQSSDMEDILTNSNKLDNSFKKYLVNRFDNRIIVLVFDKNIYFQDYITIKSRLKELNSENITISKTEFIY
ncbi:hypothetical protein [Tamlana flava]|uniref:hypothetical protein n=1 Tax=Tamlana flava TaxID=3158572 RepID=UPI00351ADCBB